MLRMCVWMCVMCVTVGGDSHRRKSEMAPVQTQHVWGFVCLFLCFTIFFLCFSRQRQPSRARKAVPWQGLMAVWCSLLWLVHSFQVKPGKLHCVQIPSRMNVLLPQECQRSLSGPQESGRGSLWLSSSNGRERDMKTLGWTNGGWTKSRSWG